MTKVKVNSRNFKHSLTRNFNPKDFEVSENGATSTTEEPCEDTEEQDTNLCPQFMPTQGPCKYRMHIITMPKCP